MVCSIKNWHQHPSLSQYRVLISQEVSQCTMEEVNRVLCKLNSNKSGLDIIASELIKWWRKPDKLIRKIWRQKKL
jgi:hypothetical protein